MLAGAVAEGREAAWAGAWAAGAAAARAVSVEEAVRAEEDRKGTREKSTH